jgi:hypothetical protein
VPIAVSRKRLPEARHCFARISVESQIPLKNQIAATSHD